MSYASASTVRVARRAAGCACVAACMGLPPEIFAQANPQTSLRREMETARSLLTSGAFREAESAYLAAIAKMSAEEQSLRASAYFGRAFAAHQRLIAGDTAQQGTSADTIVGYYEAAKSLDQSALGAAAENNIGLVLRAVGRRRDAAERFAAAARATTPKGQAPFLFNAGREYEAVGDSVNAVRMYELAVAAESSSTDALRALLPLLIERAPANVVLGIAYRWRGDSASAGIVADALAALLSRERLRPNASESATALVYLASSLPVARVGPTTFGITLLDRLRRAAAARPEAADGVNALIDAYAPKGKGTAYREPATARWWRTYAAGRLAAWSSVLRSLGDWYGQQNEEQLARTYYEAAIGQAGGSLSEDWVDRRALLPLALIYSRESDASKAGRLQGEVNRFTHVLFSAKGEAYSKGDVEQIRDFHTALGAIYVARGQWTGPGAQNAEFQLEHMREASKALARRTGRAVTDPPELLVQLAIRYRQTNRTDRAEEIKSQLREDFVRRGRPAAGDSLVRRIEIAPAVRTPDRR